MSVRIPILIAAPISVTTSGKIPLRAGRWQIEVSGCETTEISANGLPVENGKILRLEESAHIQLELFGERTGRALTVYAVRVED